MPRVWGVSSRSFVAQRWALGFGVVARMGRGLGRTGGSHLTDFRIGSRVVSGVEYQGLLLLLGAPGIGSSDDAHASSIDAGPP